VDSAGNTLVLSGEVPDVADVEKAQAIAAGFAAAGVPANATPPPVVNLLTVMGEQQVQLEVSFAEVSRSALRQIGMNILQFGNATHSFSSGVINPASGPLVDPTHTIAQDIQGLGKAGETGLPNTVVNSPLGSTFGLLFGTGLDFEFPFSVALSVLSTNG